MYVAHRRGIPRPDRVTSEERAISADRSGRPGVVARVAAGSVEDGAIGAETDTRGAWVAVGEPRESADADPDARGRVRQVGQDPDGRRLSRRGRAVFPQRPDARAGRLPLALLSRAPL